MRRWIMCGLVALAVAVAFLGGSGTRSEAATCALTPVLLDTTINQGLQSYAQLVRGKETLVRFYFGLPTCAASGNAVQVNRAQLTIKNQSASGAVLVNGIDGLAPVGTSTPPLITSTVKQIDATSDPKWVVSLVGPTASSFNASLEATLRWQSKTCATCTLSAETATTYSFVPGTRSTLITKSVAARTNALRLLVVPMALPPGGLTDADRQTLQDALTVLSRGGPFSDVGGRLGALSGATSPAGIRYTINSGFVDLTTLLRPTDGRFCGNNSNFAAIDATLASMLQSFNSLNPTNPADKVVGVVPGSLAVASAADPTCFEGESSPGGIDSWVRLGSLSGAVFMQELSHDWGIEPFSRSNGAYHSIYTTAHAAPGDPGKTYNVLERAYVKSDGASATVNADRTALISNINNAVTNSNVLLENADWNDMFCFLGGPVPTLAGSACTAARTTSGTAVGVAASAPLPAMQITAHTNGTIAGTSVVSTFVDNQLLTGQDQASDYHIVGRNSSNGITIDFRAPASPLEGHSHEEVHVDNSTVLISSTVSRPAGTVKMELWRGAPGAAGSDKLATTASDGNAPHIATATATGASDLFQIAPGSSKPAGGGSFSTPAILPKPDIFYLADTTSSMGTALDTVRDAVPSIAATVRSSQPQASFGAGQYKDLACEDLGFHLDQAITSDISSLTAAITPNPDIPASGWSASGGCDTPEDQLYALQTIATNPTVIGWRPDSTRIVAWFGDAPGHDPSGGATLDSVKAALASAGIRVVAVNVGGGALDSTGQATAITTATGGTLTSSSSSTDVAAAIVTGLHNLPTTVGLAATCDTAGFTLGVTPASQTVTSGSLASYSLTMSVSETVKPGVYNVPCHITKTFDGVAGGTIDAAFTIDVTGLAGDHTVVKWTATDDSSGPLHGDVAMKCGSLFHIIKTNVVSDSTGHFLFDTPTGCPGGEIYVSVNDGWFVTDPVKADVLTVNNTAAPPVVEISSPTDTSRVLQFSDIAMAGGGKYDDGSPVAGTNLAWKLDGSPVGTPSESVDLRPPNGGWTPGAHTLRLEGPNGSFAQVAITVLGDNDNDGVSTAQETVINSCRPGGGVPSPDNFPYNATEDNDGDLTPNASDAAPCTAETDYEAVTLMVPSRFNLNSPTTLTFNGIYNQYFDMTGVPRANVRISRIDGIDVSGPQWVATNWLVSRRFDGTLAVAAFNGATLAAFLNAHPELIGHSVLIRISGTLSDNSKSFHADGRTFVYKG
jgi:hypothetical protein